MFFSFSVLASLVFYGLRGIVSVVCNVVIHLMCSKHEGTTRQRASSYDPGRPGWLGFRDLASPLFSLQKFGCVHMRRRAGPVTEISVTELEIFRI